MSLQTSQLGLYEWNAATDQYNHTQLAGNWSIIDSQLLKKAWAKSGDEATQIKFFGATGFPIFMSSASGSAYPFYSVDGVGYTTWGPGNNPVDTSFYRYAPGWLRTNATFTIDQNLIVSGTANIAGSVFTGALTPISLNTANGTITAGSVATLNAGNITTSGSVSVGNSLGVTGNVNVSNQISAVSGTVTTLNVANLITGSISSGSASGPITTTSITVNGSPGSVSVLNGISAKNLALSGAITGATALTFTGAVPLNLNSAALSGVTTINGATITGGSVSGGTLTATTVNNTNINNGAISNVSISNASLSGISSLAMTGAGTLGANSVLQAPVETVTIVTAQILSGTTIALNVNSSSFFLYTSAGGYPAGNWTLNAVGPASLQAGQSLTLAFAVLNGGTAYLPGSTLLIDGQSNSIYWNNNSAPSAADPNTYDIYTYTIVKTSTSPSYVVFGQQSKF